MTAYKIVCVDDEPLALRYLTSLLKEINPQNIIKTFSSSLEALEYLKNNRPDIVFLDIDMPHLNGIELARTLSGIHSRLNIILTTAYDNFALDAFSADCSGYLLKPLNIDKLKHQFAVLRYPLNMEIDYSKKLLVKCFGDFEIFYQNAPIKFKHKKSKELLAYLIDRRCALLENAKIISVLWEDDDDHTSYYKKLRSDLISTLNELPFEIILTPFGSLGLRREAIICDYFDYLDNRSSSTYTGEYMEQYSWAEASKAYLDALSKQKKGR